MLDIELGGSLNSRRTVLRLLDVVTEQVADWAYLALTQSRTLALSLHGGDDPGFEASGPPYGSPGLTSVLQTGAPRFLDLDGDPDSVRRSTADLLPNPRLLDELVALEPRALVAAPLTARGRAVGVLVLAWRRPFEFSAEDVARLGHLTDRAAIALDSARIYDDHARVTRVLEESLRPPALPDIPLLDVAGLFRPAADHLMVGGDFYDVHSGGDDWIAVLGDVCGKGVDAAVLNGRARQSIRTAVRFDRNPARILGILNDVLYDDGSDQFVTAVCARLRPVDDGDVIADIAVAGHHPPVVVRADGALEQPEITGRLAGVLPGDADYRETSVRLAPKDTMVMFSDGILEARGSGDFYGAQRLTRLLTRYAGTGSGPIVEAIERDVMEHLDDAGHDDMTALAVTPRRPHG